MLIVLKIACQLILLGLVKRVWQYHSIWLRKCPLLTGHVAEGDVVFAVLLRAETNMATILAADFITQHC